jgi:serine phosphatase RsbU (regulator of sigma subunit)
MNSTILGMVLGVLIVVVVAWLLSRKGKLDWFGPQIRQMPIERLKYLLAGRFFRMASVAFMIDAAVGGGGISRMLVVALALPFAAMGPLVLLLRRLSPAKRLLIFLPIVWCLMAVVLFVRRADVPLSAAAAAYRFDALAIFFTMLASALLTTKHINTEGARQLRAETELELAHRLQKVLVPGISFRNTRLEVYGRSIPSDQVGGDLIDLITSESSTLVYLLDVSGHGIPAGALMGSLKAAIRMTFPQPMPAMLDHLNRMLPSVKEPHMYATFGALAFEVSGESVEYTLAGHMPILHCRTGGVVERLACVQFPLGLLPVDDYASQDGACTAGDLFVLYSDGIIEVANAADEQFGMERLESEIRNRTSQPLEAICEAVMAATAAHGLPDDDRSLLLIRVLS